MITAIDIDATATNATVHVAVCGMEIAYTFGRATDGRAFLVSARSGNVLVADRFEAPVARRVALLTMDLIADRPVRPH